MNALPFAFVLLAASLVWTQQYQYPLQNPSLQVVKVIPGNVMRHDSLFISSADAWRGRHRL